MSVKRWPDGTARNEPHWHDKWSEEELRVVIREEMLPWTLALGQLEDKVDRLEDVLKEAVKLIGALVESHADLHRDSDGFLPCPVGPCRSRFIAKDALLAHIGNTHPNEGQGGRNERVD